jgi:hypothetical protein
MVIEEVQDRRAANGLFQECLEDHLAFAEQILADPIRRLDNNE